VAVTLAMTDPGLAQTSDGRAAWHPGLIEIAISSCAGGAAVGALVAWGGGSAAPLPTAAVFCGLSVSATVAANVAGMTWRGLSGLIAR